MKTAVKRAAVALLVLNLLSSFYIMPLPVQGDAEKRTHGKQILERMIAAVGGRERLSGFRDSVVTSLLKISATGETANRVFYRKRTGKMRIETKVKDVNIIMGFNGYTGWVLAPLSSTPLEMPAPLLEEMERKSIEYQARLNPDKFDLVVTFEGRKNVDGRECFILKQVYRDGYISTMCLDAATCLPFKIIGMALTDTLEKAEMEAVFSDYRDVQGTKVPFSTRIFQGGKETASLSVLEYKYNVGLEDSFFERP